MAKMRKQRPSDTYRRLICIRPRTADRFIIATDINSRKWTTQLLHDKRNCPTHRA